MRHRDDPETDLIDWPLLHRHLAGEASPEEESRFAKWVAARPGRREYIESLRAMGESVQARRPVFDWASAWARMREDLDHAGHQVGRRVAPHAQVKKESIGRQTSLAHAWPRAVGRGAKGQRGWWGGWADQKPAPTTAMAIAAMVLVAIGVGLVLRRSLVSNPRFLTPAVREYATTAGQRLSITLVDGTQLTLAPASRVRLGARYGQGGREVALDGEAYFAVVHDAAHPFSVRAGNAVVTDIGTQFDVRAYRDDRETRVAVAEGRVGLHTGGPGQNPTVATPHRALAAGDVAVIADQAISVTHGADMSALVGWTTGGIAFDSAPLGTVLVDLSRWYGVRMIAPDAALAARHVSLRLANPSLGALLSGLADAVGARVDRRGGLIVFVPLTTNQAR